MIRKYRSCLAFDLPLYVLVNFTFEPTMLNNPSNSTSSSSSSRKDNDPIPAKKEQLPIGNVSVSGPHNLVKHNLDDYTDYVFSHALGDDWEYIQGNNKFQNKGDFYADGSFKFSHLYYGLQSPLLTSYKKIEIRLYIKQVNNSTDKRKEDEPIFHIYGYNDDCSYIHTQYLQQGKITKQSEGNYVRIYLENIDVSYFELRLNANPYKGNQCYNFSINKIKLKGWNYN